MSAPIPNSLEINSKELFNEYFRDEKPEVKNSKK
jgi:hypothetical protein